MRQERALAFADGVAQGLAARLQHLARERARGPRKGEIVMVAKKGKKKAARKVKSLPASGAGSVRGGTQATPVGVFYKGWIEPSPDFGKKVR